MFQFWPDELKSSLFFIHQRDLSWRVARGCIFLSNKLTLIILVLYIYIYIDTDDTELSKHIWKLKIGNRDHHIKWSIIKHVSAYKAGSKRCNLCLEEKPLFMKAKKKNVLKKRSELFSQRRHVTKLNNELTLNKTLRC